MGEVNLKTLKDMTFTAKKSVFDCKAEVLKQEAIKWILRARDEYKRGNTCDAIDFMEFFNITEEDLE